VLHEQELEDHKHDPPDKEVGQGLDFSEEDWHLVKILFIIGGSSHQFDVLLWANCEGGPCRPPRVS
jgi:hypothetical protein